MEDLCARGKYGVPRRRHAENGLSAYYYGADRAGATYAFEYEAFAALSRVLCRINLRSNVYYVTIEGYLADSEKAAYLYTEQY